MNEAQEVFDVVVVPGQDASEVAQPGEKAFDFPASTVATQRPPVLRRRSDAVSAMRSDHLNTLGSKLLIQRVRVVGFVPDKALGFVFYEAASDSGRHEGRFVGGSARHATGDRKTRAVCHCHELCTFAPLGLSNAEPPFFATMNVPSMKHSVRSRPPRSFKSSAKALSKSLNTPERTHCWNRRWHVWYGGNSLGRSCQAAPVRIIHRMPSRTSRDSRQGLPRPSARRFGAGINGWSFSHCSSVRRRAKGVFLAFSADAVLGDLNRLDHTNSENRFMR